MGGTLNAAPPSPSVPLSVCAWPPASPPCTRTHTQAPPLAGCPSHSQGGRWCGHLLERRVRLCVEAGGGEAVIQRKPISSTGGALLSLVGVPREAVHREGMGVSD